MYVEGDVPYVTGTNSNNNGGWGDWSWIVGLAIIGALFGGNRGGLFGGGNGGDYSSVQLGRLATTNDVASGFSTSEIMSDLNSIILGQAQMQNYINQGFSGLNQTITSGFYGVDNAICTLGYQNQAGFNALSSQLAQCCCDLKTMNLENRYLNEKQTCDIIGAINAGNQRLVDIYTNEKIEGLRSENAALKGQISNDRQSAYIISALTPKCPEPAYIVPNPNCCYDYRVTGFGYGNNGGYGCGASVQ